MWRTLTLMIQGIQVGMASLSSHSAQAASKGTPTASSALHAARVLPHDPCSLLHECFSYMQKD